MIIGAKVDSSMILLAYNAKDAQAYVKAYDKC